MSKATRLVALGPERFRVNLVSNPLRTRIPIFKDSSLIGRNVQSFLDVSLSASPILAHTFKKSELPDLKTVDKRRQRRSSFDGVLFEFREKLPLDRSNWSRKCCKTPERIWSGSKSAGDVSGSPSRIHWMLMFQVRALTLNVS